ncbi:MAG: nucleoside-triphosphatase [Planctomycetes bacterium]|nr:nucleoside-triphosphatase [Planctomycetota bacterium]
MAFGELTIVTGEKGAGKTTYVRHLAADRVGRGHTVGGVISVAVFEHGHRVGYDLLDARTGDCRPLARVVDLSRERATIGQFKFFPEAVTAGNAAIMAATRDGMGLVVIDEVGPLEFRGGGWAPALEVAIAEGTKTQGLVVVVRPALIEKLPQRFGNADWAGATRVTAPWPTTAAG